MFQMFRNIYFGCFSCYEAGHFVSFRSLIYMYIYEFSFNMIDSSKIKYIGGDICLPLHENKKYGIRVNTYKSD